MRIMESNDCTLVTVTLRVINKTVKTWPTSETFLMSLRMSVQVIKQIEMAPKFVTNLLILRWGFLFTQILDISDKFEAFFYGY